MKNFLNENFLLQDTTAQQLYHECAEGLPIIDYHCHLDPRLIAEDHHFRSITELWLDGDHYKWRAMRANGVEEALVTGRETSDWDRFEAWAHTVPYTMRNPLYHWTHMELKSAFGITRRLSSTTARDIFEETNERLQNDPAMTARGLMRRYSVEVVCTTDDPVDDLRYHRQLRDEGFEIKVLPTWRPDKALVVDSPADFRNYVEKLSAATDKDILRFSDFVDALQSRHDYFADMGCRLSDHGLSTFYDKPYSDAYINRVFDKALRGDCPDAGECDKFRSAMLYILALQDYEAGWTQQFHYGPLRNNSTRLYQSFGPDAGGDSMGDERTAHSMAHFLDRLDREGRLARTILYNINPADNAMVATMVGNFQDGSVPGKIQWGAGWWFLDQKDGIEQQLNTLSAQGLLSRFVGMLTDSRSFLSYPRHDYFRRILCNLIGTDIDAGLIPYDGYERQRIHEMIGDICYHNARRYFKFYGNEKE